MSIICVQRKSAIVLSFVSLRTWFRHQMPDWSVIERSDVGEMAAVIERELE